MLTSWFMEGSSTYAELFESAEDEKIIIMKFIHGVMVQAINHCQHKLTVSYSDKLGQQDCIIFRESDTQL